MADPILPSDDEVRALIPTPGSIVWRLAGDARILAAAGYALLLQVSHPTVGAGVKEHSLYSEDPWGRLLRTLDYTNTVIYGGPDAAAETGRRVREMHKRIKGVKRDGKHYHALEPEAYAWVHATLAEAIVAGHRRFGDPLSHADTERFWAQWRPLGRLVGVRESDLPGDWNGFRAYRDEKVRDRLEDNAAVHDVLATLGSPATPPLPALATPLWGAARIPAARALKLSTVGMLPATLRERFGLRWSRADELSLRAIGAASRASGPLLPRSLRVMGPGYLDWRRAAIERGEGPAAARTREPVARVA